MVSFSYFSHAQKQDTSLRINRNASHLQQIDKGVYAITHDNPTDQWPTSNTGVIVGDKYVLVVDANYLPSLARTDIELIKQVTNKPVKYVVYTHWHMDHNNGGIEYKLAYPGVEIVSQRMVAQYIAVNSPWYAKKETVANSAKRVSLAQLEKDYTAGKDTTGKVFTNEELKSLDTLIGQRKNELKEFETMQVVVPDKLFDDTLALDLGNRKVFIKDWIRANSPHDATIYLPKEQILFTGDMLMQAPRPFTGESWPVTWAKNLVQVEKIPVKQIIPGHGPVLYGHDYTKQMRGLLEATIAEVKRMLSEGIPADQIPNLINLDHLRKGVWDVGKDPDPVWNSILRTLTERTVKCIRGQGGLSE
jgi:glyoxylase-like metal-dependent hydrolase (beta-lactamase superfamily II)